MAAVIQITCSLSPVIIIFKGEGRRVVLQGKFSSGEETGKGETDSGKNLLWRERYAGKWD